ncbi:hypothetical protein QC764_307504 [Podospora pseudoanserina]|uniref:Uncharacterized protein n=1 Tax=Podospora pseudoanserina TaxID=2609844 RepID=A0ABR0IDE5_9PEZI|nr:hypothetical protein QC764_307504 [Podospora pseudoanserina]
MKPFTLLLTTFSLFVSPISANTEKTIFIAPPAVDLPISDQTITTILTSLNRLTPLPTNQSTLRTLIPVSFPTTSHPTGTESWYLLHDLTPAQRYEVRICWAATQPTSFDLQTFPITEIPSLPSLTSYLNPLSPSSSPPKDLNNPPTRSSLLLLRLLAKADFYTTNQTLMSNPPPVAADLILDPFLLNLLPRSLAPTAGYIILVAITSWFLARGVSRALSSLIIDSNDCQFTKDEKKTQ